jgi:hypothetical protein
MAMPESRPTRFGRGSRLDFVSDWEDLPDGEWLENDEHGVHWYRTNEGDHWHSTDDGYRLWVEDEDGSNDDFDESSTEEVFEDEEDQDFDDDSPSGPVPRLGTGTALLSIGLALFVLAWTLLITIPAAEHTLEGLNSGTSSIAPEIDHAMVEGLELHQTYNTLTLVMAAAAIIIGGLSLVKKTPWWAVIASQGGLLAALLSASRAGLSAEYSRLDACDPTVYACYELEPGSMLSVVSLFPTMSAFVAVLFLLNQSMKAWANFDAQEEPLPEGTIQLFSSSAPRLGGFPALIGLLMALAVASFTHFFAIPATQDNIDLFGGSLTPQGELFQSIQGFNELVVNAALLVMVVSLLTLVKKMPWWALPACILPLITLEFITIGENQFNGLLAYEQDAFYTGACSMVAFVIIGVSAFRTMVEHDWEEDDDDFGVYDNSGTKNHFDFYDDEEEDNEWRPKVKIGVMACALLLAGIGGFFSVQFALGEADGPAFQIRDANGVLSNGSYDELVVVDMLDKTNAYSEETLRVSLQINNDETVECTWKSNGQCTFVYLELFEDRRLTAMESILISEGGLNWCSGEAEETCKVTVQITHIRSEEDEDMQVSVSEIDLGSYTLKAS